MTGAGTIGDQQQKIADFAVGDVLRDVLGPLGHPSAFIQEPLEAVQKRRYIFIGQARVLGADMAIMSDNLGRIAATDHKR